MNQTRLESDISITLEDWSQRTHPLDLKKVMSPPWLKDDRVLLGEDTPRYEPFDLDSVQSRHLEEQITALALEHGASFSEEKQEKLDAKHRLETDPEGYRKAYIFDDLTLTDTLIRNIEYVLGVGGGTLLLKSAKDLLLQWLKNKATRQIRIQKGNTSISIRGKNDFPKVLQLLQGLNKKEATNVGEEVKTVGKKRSTKASSGNRHRHTGKDISTKRRSKRKL
jgi:hypothetical protein